MMSPACVVCKPSASTPVTLRRTLARARGGLVCAPPWHRFHRALQQARLSFPLSNVSETHVCVCVCVCPCILPVYSVDPRATPSPSFSRDPYTQAALYSPRASANSQALQLPSDAHSPVHVAAWSAPLRHRRVCHLLAARCGSSAAFRSFGCGSFSRAAPPDKTHGRHEGLPRAGLVFNIPCNMP